MLKERSLYKGEATGTYNANTRAGIKSFQKDNGLKGTGTLNRATLEKMNVELTDSQKLIPVSESSYASAETRKEAGKGGKGSSVDGRCKGKESNDLPRDRRSDQGSSKDAKVRFDVFRRRDGQARRPDTRRPEKISGSERPEGHGHAQSGDA